MATFTLPNANYGTTPVVSGPFDLPQKVASAEFVTIRLTSSNWSSNPGRRLILTIEQSLDNGQTWRAFSADTFTKNAFARDGSMPSIKLSFNDGGGVAFARLFRVTLVAPDGTVNVGFIATF